MITKIWAYLYLWFNNYCPKHIEEKVFSTWGYECRGCIAEKEAQLHANVEHARKILQP